MYAFPYEIHETQTSSPMSPPTGIVMRTTCEYRPVHRTLRKTAELEGKAPVILGK